MNVRNSADRTDYSKPKTEMWAVYIGNAFHCFPDIFCYKYGMMCPVGYTNINLFIYWYYTAYWYWKSIAFCYIQETVIK